MVAADKDGRPTRIPPFVPSTGNDRRRHRAAELRRELRREFEGVLLGRSDAGED
jgi:acyl-CoA hydrolase